MPIALLKCMETSQERLEDLPGRKSISLVTLNQKVYKSLLTCNLDIEASKQNADDQEWQSKSSGRLR